MQEIWVWSLDQEDPLEKEMAIHSSTLAWRIPWTEEPGSPQHNGLQELGTIYRLNNNKFIIMMISSQIHGLEDTYTNMEEGALRFPQMLSLPPFWWLYIFKNQEIKHTKHP